MLRCLSDNMGDLILSKDKFTVETLIMDDEQVKAANFYIDVKDLENKECTKTNIIDILKDPRIIEILNVQDPKDL